ncbi:MAG: hypothetical protein ACXW00_03950 [Methylobacter sp.]
MSYQQQKYLGGMGNNNIGFEQQKDYISKVSFDFMYHPLNFISIGVLLNYEKRDSNYSP